MLIEFFCKTVREGEGGRKSDSPCSALELHYDDSVERTLALNLNQKQRNKLLYLIPKSSGPGSDRLPVICDNAW